jgi:CRISPR system Cascade subunit CasC
MSQFIQIHVLTSYPPSNLNRDDLGRPKTAVLGGAKRLRVSSQSQKRAWRTSDFFQQALAGHVGTRTKAMGTAVLKALKTGGVPEKTAHAAAEKIAGVFGEPKSAGKKGEEATPGKVEIKQLAHFSPEERAAIDALVAVLVAEKREPVEAELKLLKKKHRAVDIALFGRMLADAPDYNVEAAAQVAHAITVHQTDVEDDYFSAVDDLNTGEEDRGAGHIGEAEFAAGLFYLYVCINRDLLVDNLDGDEELAAKALRSLTEAAAKVAPSGKQASFASRAYASYILVEKGRQQPRSLSVAFLKPVRGGDFLSEAVQRLGEARQNLDAVYGPTADATYEVNAATGSGRFDDLLRFVAVPLPAET